MSGTTRQFIDPEVISRLSRLDVRARGVVEGSFSGMHKSPHRGSSVEFSQYRKYVPGDDISNVDWRVYAKTDRFYIKEFEADTNLRCHIIVDTSGSMGFGNRYGTKLNYALKIAATLAQLLIQQGDTVGLQCFADDMIHDLPAGGSARHLGNIFTLLSELRPEGETQIIRVLHSLAEKIHRRAMVILFSDCFTDIEALLDCFQHMKFRKHDLTLFHIMDPDELEFTFDTPIRFMDMESSFSIISEPQLIRQEYITSLNEYLSEIKQGCREFHVDYRFASLSVPYDKILSEFLLARQ